MELHTSSNGEMQGSFLNPSNQPDPLQLQQQIPNGHHQIASDPPISQFDPSSPHDEFLEQMLSSLPSYTWPPAPDDHQFQNHYDDSPPSLLAAKLRQNQISGGGGTSAAAALALQQQLLLSGGDSGLLPLPLSLDASSGDSSGDYRLLLDRSQNDGVDVSSFKPSKPGGEGSMQGLFNGFTAGSLHGTTAHSAPNQTQHFRHSQAQNKGAPTAAGATTMNQSAAAGSAAAGGAPAQPRQRVRARRGQATDPHSIAERLRRERIAERMKALQELVPNANKTDKASMLDEIIDYVKFIQLQVKVLSMSRLGGAAAVAPLMAGLSSERGGDCVQASAGGPSGAAVQRSSNGGDSLKVTEQRVAKLMEEDMGSAMQYLQGKGLCLMPISLATAISTATCHPSAAPRSASGDGPSSPNVSVLTAQSAAAAAGINGTVDASVSKA